MTAAKGGDGEAPERAASAPIPAQNPDPARSRRGLVVVLAAICVALLLATIGFGIAALALSGRAQSPSSTPPDSTPDSAPSAQNVQGYQLDVVSDSGVTFGDFVMNLGADGEVGVVHALITNTTDQARHLSFDVTSYAEDGHIIGRLPASQYLLANQQSLFTGFLPADMTGASRIVVEQTGVTESEAPVAGTITLTDLAVTEGAVVKGTFTSTLDTPVELADLFIVGTSGGDIFVVGSTIADLPANGEFTASIRLYLATKGDPGEFDEIPSDAEYEVYFEMTAPR